MAESKAIGDILKSYKEIKTVVEISSGIFLIKILDKNFVFIFNKSYEIDSYPSIYLYNDEGFDFPHIMLDSDEVLNDADLPDGKYRHICLNEAEELVYSLLSFEEKVKDVIDKLLMLLSMEKYEREKEFQKEFLYYWNNSSESASVNVYISDENKFSPMDVYSSKNQMRYIETGIELTDLEECEKKRKKWMHRIECEVFHIPITDTRDIVPPYRGHPWTTKDVQNIVFGKQIEHISSDTYKHVISQKVVTQNVAIVFTMSINETKIAFAVKIICKNIKNRNLRQKICDDANSISSIKTYRKDYSFLSHQIGNDTGLSGKKVLLIGAGSLGSYVASELVKNGVSVIRYMMVINFMT